MFFEHTDRQFVFLRVALAGVTLNGTFKLDNISLQGSDQVMTFLNLFVVLQVPRLKVLFQFFFPVQIHLNYTGLCIIINHSTNMIESIGCHIQTVNIYRDKIGFNDKNGIRIMEQAIKKIVAKFKDHEPLGYPNNKQNRYKNQTQSPNFVDELQKPNKRIQRLETTIDSLITEANTVFRYYHEALREAMEKQDHLREQISLSKAHSQQEQKESETQIKDLNHRIEELNRELNLKSIQYHDLLEKYEDYEEETLQIRVDNEEKLRSLEESMTKSTLFRDRRIQILEEQVRRLNNLLEEEIKLREEVFLNNLDLRKVNDDLRITIDVIQKKTRLIETSQFKRAWSPEKEDDLLDCQIISRQRYDDEVFTFEEVKMNESQELQTHTAKEVLDLSEHYSKFNRTQDFLSKEKPGSLLDMNSNESKPIRAHRCIQQTANQKTKQNNKSVYLQIATIQSRDEVIHLQSLKSKNTQQINQFNMPNQDEADPEVDPYRAFFALMVQCQKMNSPNFNRICGEDLNYLYDYFVLESIPYNQWQRQIRKRLKQASAYPTS